MNRSGFLFLLLLTTAQAFPRFYGEWTLWHSTVPALPDNRVVIHIYPDNHLTMKYRFMKGPFVFHKSKVGIYSISTNNDDNYEEKHNVDVLFHHTEEIFLSAYGIGLQNFNIKTDKKKVNTKFRFSMTMAGTDDIYLQSTKNDDCFHIVRSVRINEPSVDIPISTFVITQIVGTIMGHVINEILFHSN